MSVWIRNSWLSLVQSDAKSPSGRSAAARQGLLALAGRAAASLDAQ